jgi:predicted metal-binding protein
MRKCKKCGQTKKINEFKKEKLNITGYSLTLCADCHRQNEKIKQREKKEGIIIAF